MKRQYRYYDLLLAAFVVVLLCSNFIGAGKTATLNIPGLGPIVFGAGILFFPISYFFGDILTEVYGYAYDRRAVWAGFWLYCSRGASRLFFFLFIGVLRHMAIRNIDRGCVSSICFKDLVGGFCHSFNVSSGKFPQEKRE